jgi:hypothetical protein
MSDFTIRPQQFRKIEASLIDPHPDNFRVHTDNQQSKLSAIMAEIGFVGTIIVRPYKKGRYQCLDGHERLSRFAPDEKIPCLVVKLSDEEAAKFLATFDTITGLAATDREALERLTAGLEWEQDGLDALIADTLDGAEQFVSDAMKDLDATSTDDAADEEEPAPAAEEEPKAKVPKATHECPKCGFQWKGEARPGK